MTGSHTLYEALIVVIEQTTYYTISKEKYVLQVAILCLLLYRDYSANMSSCASSCELVLPPGPLAMGLNLCKKTYLKVFGKEETSQHMILFSGDMFLLTNNRQKVFNVFN